MAKAPKNTNSAIEKILPVIPNRRISVSADGQAKNTYENLIGQAYVNPVFPIEYIDLLSRLSIVNPDLTHTISNIVELSNSGHSIEIVCDDQATAEAALEYLSDKAATLATNFAGMDGFINSMLGQIARTGALSIEWVPEEDLSGIKEVVFVPTQTIRFKWDEKTQIYYPCQKVKGGIGNIQDKDIELNPLTYLYSPLETIDASPYGVPPFIAALTSIGIQKDIINNLKFLTKKMGIMGLMRVLVKAPARKTSETETAYTERCRQYLSKIATEITSNYNDGLMVGFAGAHDFKHESTTADARGANTIYELNEEQLASGMRTDPGMIGRSYHRTETFVSVIYDKMVKQFGGYQRIVKRGIEFGYKLDLLLAGFTVDDVNLFFNEIRPLDEEKKEKAEETHINNVNAKLAMGVIDLDTAAQELGYPAPIEQPEQPEEPEPPEEDEEQSSKSFCRFVAAWKNSKYDLITIPPKGLGATASSGGKSPISQIVAPDTVPSRQPTPTTHENGQTSEVCPSKLTNASEPQSASLYRFYSHLTAAPDGQTILLRVTKKGLSDFLKAERMYYSELEQYFAIALTQALDAAAKEIRMLRRNFPAISAYDWADRVFDRVNHIFHTAFDGRKPSVSIIEAIARIYSYYYYWDKTVLGNAKIIQDRGARDFEKRVLDMIELPPDDRVDLDPLYKPHLKNSDFGQNEIENIDKNDVSVSRAEKINTPVYSNLRMGDKRAVKWLAQSDNYYLGKFVDNDAVIQKGIKDFLVKEYLENGLAIGKSPANIAAFQARFGEKIATNEYGIRRIIDTTVNRTRNCANISYMEAVGVVSFEISNPQDNRTCPTCGSMIGRVFKVEQAFHKQQIVMNHEPQDIPTYSPFLTGTMPTDVLSSLSDDDLQGMGFDAPPYHCNCYDAETEVLTREHGFRLLKDIDGSEHVMTVDLDGLRPEYQSIKNVIRYPYQGKMIQFKGKNFNIVVTPEHNMVVAKRWGYRTTGQKKFELIPAKDMPAEGFVPRCFEYEGVSIPSVTFGDTTIDGDVFATFMGWYLAEGHVTPKWHRGEVRITQSFDVHEAEIYLIAHQLASMNPRIWQDGVGFRVNGEFRDYLMQFGHAVDKFIPDEIMTASRHQIELFLEAFCLGDGSHIKGDVWNDGEFRDHRLFFTSSPMMASQIGELMMKMGRTPHYWLNKVAGTQQKFRNGTYTINHDVWRIYEGAGYDWGGGRSIQEYQSEIDYEGVVHCVEVEKFNTLVVRRQGQVCICGNCRCRCVIADKEVRQEGSPPPVVDDTGGKTKKKPVKPMPKGIRKVPPKPKIVPKASAPPKVGKKASVRGIAAKDIDGVKNNVAARKYYTERLEKQMSVFRDPVNQKKIVKLFEAGTRDNQEAALQSLFSMLRKAGVTGAKDYEAWWTAFRKDMAKSLADVVQDTMNKVPGFTELPEMAQKYLRSQMNSYVSSTGIGWGDQWGQLAAHEFFRKQGAADWVFGHEKFLDLDTKKQAAFRRYLRKIRADELKQTSDFLKPVFDDLMLDLNRNRFAFTRAMQRDFYGDETITLYRGMRLEQGISMVDKVDGMSDTLHSNPLSCWSSDVKWSERWAKGTVLDDPLSPNQVGIVYQTQVKASDIAFDPLTMGNLSEFEFDIIASKEGIKATVHKVYTGE